MNYFFKRIFFVGYILVGSHAVNAADISNGKTLHDGNCINCHASLLGGDGTSIYTRENRKMESYAGLDKQVRRYKDKLRGNHASAAKRAASLG